MPEASHATPRERKVGTRGFPRPLFAATILALLLILVTMPAVLPAPRSNTGLEDIAGLLRHADILALSSLKGVDTALCDYYEATRHSLDDYAGGGHVREIVVKAERAVVQFTPAKATDNGSNVETGVLVEKMASGGLLCQRTKSSVGASWNPLTSRLELRLEGGLFELRLSPLGGFSVEVNARDSMVYGQLVDVGELRLRLDSSLVDLVSEVNGGQWGGMDLWLKDSFARLFLAGTVRDNAAVNVETRSSFLILEPFLGWVCLQNTVVHDSLVSTHYLPCSRVSGYAPNYVQVNLRAWDSLVIIPKD